MGEGEGDLVGVRVGGRVRRVVGSLVIARVGVDVLASVADLTSVALTVFCV